MKLSELQRRLDDLDIEAGPDYDPEVIIVSEQPWKILRKVTEGKISNIKETKNVVRLE